MSMGWGLAREAALIEAGDDPEWYPPAADLDEGQVAAVADLAGIYGTRAEMVYLARRILAKWGADG